MERKARGTSELLELDRNHVWHPFTQMQDWFASEPLVIEGGQGSYLVDTEGRRYLDGISSLWVNVHGHRHPALDAALRDQVDRIAHSTLLGLASTPSIELAARLVEVAPPGLSRVFYSDSGSTAVEIALKIAFQYWQNRGVAGRTRFLHLGDAYHGDTLGAVAVGGIPLFHQVFGPIVIETLSVPAPHQLRHPGESTERLLARSLAALEEILVERGAEIAAFILEPLVQGAAGMWMQPPGYLQGAAALCRRHGVLLIADEVATGFGRTGTLFACQQEGVTPDLLCLAKGITGGYLPLAATLATDAIYEAFLGPRREQRTFFHGHTYTGNPLACAVAIASLDLFEREGVLPRVRESEDRLARGMAAALTGHPAVGEIRQRGLMVGIDLLDPAPPGALDRLPLGVRVCLEARRRGVILRPLGDTLVLMPPLSISDAELDELVAVLVPSIDAALSPARRP